MTRGTGGRGEDPKAAFDWLGEVSLKLRFLSPPPRHRRPRPARSARAAAPPRWRRRWSSSSTACGSSRPKVTAATGASPPPPAAPGFGEGLTRGWGGRRGFIRSPQALRRRLGAGPGLVLSRLWGWGGDEEWRGVGRGEL